MSVRVLHGDCREVLATLEPQSVQCCVTSPPFFGLRSYLPAGHPDKGREIGAEATPAEFVAALVEVFTGVWRVLRGDGCLFVELGDTYSGNRGYQVPDNKHKDVGNNRSMKAAELGVPAKSLLGIPWRVAFALQDAGWILRSEIIWHRPNPMPESVQDRVTRSHSTVFMFAKQARYYFDAIAIAEPCVKGSAGSTFTGGKTGVNGLGRASHAERADSTTRNARSVWTIATQPYSSGRPDVDHFAVFPEALPERCLLAGTSPQACEHCSAPWRRVVERTPMLIRNGPKSGGYGSRTTDGLSGTMLAPATQSTTGWEPTCQCGGEGTGRCVVLDPFAGSGTVLRVATRHGRDALGVDLNLEYLSLVDERTTGVQMSMESVLR